jgi:hypothetical protein
MTAHERAMDILWKAHGKGNYSKELFLKLVEDNSETGKMLRHLCTVIEEGIEADRKAQKAKAPS